MRCYRRTHLTTFHSRTQTKRVKTLQSYTKVRQHANDELSLLYLRLMFSHIDVGSKDGMIERMKLMDKKLLLA